MKKLSKLFLSMMLVLGMGTAFAQEGGDEPTTPSETIEAPTFSPAAGAVPAGTQVSISGGEEGYLTSYKIAYVIDNADFDFDQYLGKDVPYSIMYTEPIVINTAKTITAAIYEYDELNEEVLGWSEKVTAAYTVTQPETPGDEVPVPTFTTATGTIARGTIVGIEAPDDPDDDYTYAVYRVLNNEDFDFSQYLGDDKLVKKAGASSILYYRVISTTTITAATAKIEDGAIVGWSEKVSATYTVEGDPINVPAPVFNPNNGVVAEGGKILLNNGTESDETPLLIYYNTKVTGSEEFDKVLTKTQLENALKINFGSAKLTLYPAEGISITKSPTPINAATAKVDANDSVIWSPVVIKEFTIGEAPTPGEKPAAPVFTPDGGNVQRGTAITLTGSDEIYYSFSASELCFTVETVLELGMEETYGDLIRYTDGIILDADATIKAAVVHTNDDETLVWSDIVTKSFTLIGDAPQTVATPVITPANDAVVHIGDTVRIICATEGAEIYYTTDGSVPYTTDEKGNEITGVKEGIPTYTGPFALTQEMLIRQGTVYAIKIRAVAKKGNAIEVAGAGYVVYPNAPVFSVPAGEVREGKEVAIACIPTQADIYYTTDGSTPTMENSPKYTAPIAITGAMTLKAVAVLGQYQSSVVSAAYTIRNEVDPNEVILTFNPASGTEVEEGTAVTITSDKDVDIFYMMFATAAEAYAAAWNQEEAEAYGEETKPVLSIEKPVIKAAYIRKDAEEIDNEFFYAIYTVTKKPVVVVPDTVKVPTFSVAAGEVAKGTKVEIACETEDAKIYYSINADTVTVNSLEYTAAISIDSAMTIKAIAVKEGMENSKIAEAAYTIKKEEDPSANEGLELQGVSIYPNPNSGVFYIELPVDATVEVFATSGMLCQRMNVAAGKTELTIGQSGIYFVRIMGESRSTVKRVIVR